MPNGCEPQKRLIIHTHDLGVAHSINQATFAALQDGVVTSASIMVPCPWFLEAADFAVQHPTADIGIHITLTNDFAYYRWRPVAPPSSIESLVDSAGYLLADEASLDRKARCEHVEIEARAQIDFALRSGVNPSHLTACASARIPDSLWDSIANNYKLDILIYPGQINLRASQAKRRAGCVYVLTGETPDDRRAAEYVRMLMKVWFGCSVLGVHLGSDNEELGSIMNGSYRYDAKWRAVDDQSIRSEAFRDALRSGEITLCTSSALSTRESGRRLHDVDAVPCNVGSIRSIGYPVHEVDWTNRATTPDQLAVVRVLEGYDLSAKRILHVGAGNSQFALTFASKVVSIDALTVSVNELNHGRRLRLPNYTTYLRNKYEPGLPAFLARRYDVIVDNNLGSFCCCRYHLQTMLEEYAELLNPDGVILTDQKGMDWKSDLAGVRLGVVELMRLTTATGMALRRVTGSVYSLKKLR